MNRKSTSNCKKIENAFSLVSEKAILIITLIFDSIEKKTTVNQIGFLWGNWFWRKSLDKNG